MSQRKVPPQGYKLPLWNLDMSYRATALAYMQREGIKKVKNKNGEKYSFDEIRNSLLSNLK